MQEILVFQYLSIRILYGVNGKCETGRGVMMMYRYDSRTGFLVVLAPSESVKDRSLSAVLIGD